MDYESFGAEFIYSARLLEKPGRKFQVLVKPTPPEKAPEGRLGGSHWRRLEDEFLPHLV